MQGELLAHTTIDMLHRQAERLGVRILEAHMPGTTCGLYCDRLRVIWLADWLNDRQRLCTLCHELVHAEYRDVMGHGGFDARCELRARRETALRLVSPVDYKLVEQMFDAEPWSMAVELGVTMQVLEDYRHTLESNGGFDVV